VISSSFGFTELLARHGVERRVHTAGKDKSMLDPFRPERPGDIKRLKALQKQIHDAFIAHVKARRGSRLSEDQDLFSGEFWLGESAINLGLADGIGHLVPTMKGLFGDKTKFSVLGQKKSILRRFSSQIAAETLGAVGRDIEDNALWAQFGLSR